MHEVQTARILVPGRVPSKKNQYGVNRFGRMYVKREVARYQDKVSILAAKVSLDHSPRLTFHGPLRITLICFLPPNQDIDNMLGAIFDGLKKSPLLDDDVQFKEQHQWHIDVKKDFALAIIINRPGENILSFFSELHRADPATAHHLAILADVGSTVETPPTKQVGQILRGKL
jgi:Holliday junction resolvase RusA-like endonuclease